MTRPRLIAAVVVVSVLVVFGRLCTSEFTWYDDSATIHQNPSFNPPTWSKVMGYWTQWGTDAPLGLYIPLTYTVWGVLSAMAYSPHADPGGFHLNPWIFHTANVLIHAASALLVFSLLRRLVVHPWAAGVGALVFALHPVQVEPVGWVSGTKDVLCGLLSLLALWQYVMYVSNPDGSRRKLHYAIATATLVAAMLSKPTAVVVPLIALLIDTLMLHTPFTRSLRRLLPWLLLIIPCILWTNAAQTTADIPIVSYWARPLIAMDSLAFYLLKLVWPVHLTVVYERTPQRVLESGWCYFTWILPALLGIALTLNRKRGVTYGCAGAIFVAGVLPVLGFVPFQFQQHSSVADHYLYLSMLGVALCAAALVDRFRNRAMIASAVAALLVLAILSFHQCGTWKNEQRLWEQNLAVNPDSVTPHRKLAQIFAGSGQLDLAIHHFEQVLRIGGQLPQSRRQPLDNAHHLLGLVLMSRGQYEKAAEHFRAALAENPQLDAARRALAESENKLREPPTTR